MVGRLVENQQVDRLQQQTNHSQSTTLSTTKHLDLFVSGLASKHKGAKDIVDAQTDIASRHIVDGLKHREVLVQQLRLVLCEVTYLHVMSNLQVAVEGNLAHNTFHQR